MVRRIGFVVAVAGALACSQSFACFGVNGTLDVLAGETQDGDAIAGGMIPLYEGRYRAAQ